MKCPFCSSEQSNVIDKRAVKTSGEIRRRRVCLKCNLRFTTYERVSEIELFVVKRDGRRELFDPVKIRLGLQKALEKRPGEEFVNEMVDKIVTRLRTKAQKDIQSKVIGQAVLSELKKQDKVAYLRFASVYRQFSGVDDFAKELKVFMPEV